MYFDILNLFLDSSRDSQFFSAESASQVHGEFEATHDKYNLINIWRVRG